MDARLLASLSLILGLSACSAPPGDSSANASQPPSENAGAPPLPSSTPQPLDDITRARLARSTGFHLSSDLTFLGTKDDAGIDRHVAFAVRMKESQVPAFLERGGFATPLRPGQRVFQTPIDGVDTAGATKVSAAQDRFRADTLTYTRDVMVIHEADGTAIVHVWAYTT